MDDESFTEDKSDSFEINYTNNKGFFLYLTKNLELISEFRLRGEYDMWFKTLDSLYLATFPFWKNPDKKNEYKTLYEGANNIFNNMAQARSGSINKSYTNKLLKTLRSMNELISENTAHLMIRISNSDADDESFWDEVTNENKQI